MKNYRTIKIKTYLKNYSLLFIANNINQNSKNQILIKQNLTRLNLSLSKIYNILIKKIFQKSKYKNCIKLIFNILYLIIPKKKKFNISLITKIEIFKLSILGIKINNKIYQITQLKDLKLTSYKAVISIFYQFLLVNFKFIQIFNS